ncbi:ABC-three component system middle component 2 [Lactococcus lactis]|uniref:ABC-three component system middle component 2 n=1 Tax=Lactococcus lactis TaxID=1358 RepID=UPI0011BBD77B|nr:ABC-three component system middle component 2 [Lactococcus lactis]MDG4957204.1 hypothetical protein [Lactococcus lactis]QEA61258.1 hypothetical protein FGL73_06975 [Lactococcus lactis]
MSEIIKGIGFQEYYLTLIRVCTFLDYLGVFHKKNTSEERLVLFDFYLKYPEIFINNKERLDFDTKYSYFHWKPNYKLYSAVLADLRGRELVVCSEDSKSYFITEKGRMYVSDMTSSYTQRISESSEYVIKNICKLSSKQISINIDRILLEERGHSK